ncbi:lytic murein transglycosylase [Thioclava litoralis]|uniref:Lytic murein transglycosylase n=1 Tax=Thioclava litoralis TaxID=3076557 RepID=A0ABZ1E4E8_9RHOB|nr:lytic murein transglycosylase [Thioclava sp. FTW29]
MKSLFISFLVVSSVAAAPLSAAGCGGNFTTFLSTLTLELQAEGLSDSQAKAFLHGARIDPEVLKADRAQGVFRLDFDDFARRVISRNRLETGAYQAVKQGPLLQDIEQNYGVSRGVLLAFWGLETDFGQVQGTYKTRDALLTLAHDCRRPQLFLPQVMAAAKLYARGDFDPLRTRGAWAGEIGQVQMLPRDILENGVDGDGDGHVDLKGSAADALTSAARLLRHLGWQPNAPWLQEVTLPDDLDWARTGLDHPAPISEWVARGVVPRDGVLDPALSAAVILPMGRKGPAFLAYPNFEVLFEWNKSFVYVTTAAYFATRLEGAPVFEAGHPDPGLSKAQIKILQEKLSARGADVGTVDGILGRKTRAAVQGAQSALGLPADAWPTVGLLNRL